MDDYKTNLDTILKNVLSENIKVSSYKNYRLIIIKLYNLVNTKKIFHTDLNEIELLKGFSKTVLNYELIINFLENTENQIKDNTKKNYINALLNIITKIPNINKYNKLSLKKLKNIKENIDKYWIQLRHNINENKSINIIEEQKFISNEEFDLAILKCRKEFDKSQNIDLLQDFIVLMLYRGKYIPPIRNNYATLKIIDNTESLEDNFNYIIRNKENGKNEILIQDDKVAKCYGSQKYQITKTSILNKYLNILLDNREANKKLYLLEITGRNKKGQELSSNGLTYYLQNLCLKHFDKKISSSELRKIFISQLPTNLTNHKLGKIASKMRHSLETQQFTYKKINPNKIIEK